MRYLFIIFLIFSSCGLLREIGGLKRRLVIDWTSTECTTFEPEIVTEADCWIVRRPRRAGMLNISFKIMQDLNNVTAKFRVAINSNGKYIDYVKGELDMCVAMQEVHANYLVELIIQEIRRVGNLPLLCPFKKDTTYYMKNLTLEPRLFPAFLPNLDWTFYLEFLVNGKIPAKAHMFGTIRK